MSPGSITISIQPSIRPCSRVRAQRPLPFLDGLMSHQSRCSWLILLCVSCAGCGSGGPPLAKVSGTVTCRGQPVSKLVVHFVPQGARESWGGTDNDGAYRLRYDRQREGAVIGKHNVWV